MARVEKVMIPRQVKTSKTPVEPKEKVQRVSAPVSGVFKRKFTRTRADKTTYEYEGDVWYVAYQIINSKGKPERIKKSCGKFTNGHLTTKEEAKKYLAECIAKENAKSHPERLVKKDLTFKEFVQQIYLKLPDTLKMEGLKEHKQVLGEVCDGLDEVPLSEEEEKRKIHNPKALGRFKLSVINQQRVEDYIGVKEERGNADSTLNRHLAAIKKVVRIAFEKSYAPHNTVVELKKIPTRTEMNSKINYLRLAQLPIFLIECQKKSDYLWEVVDFMLATGIRTGRIYRLEWSMIDMESGIIRIPKDKHADRYSAPLGEGAMRILKERLKVRRPGVPFVFFNETTGERWADLSESFKDARENAVKECIELKIETTGLETLVPHDCRHTFISHLVMKGVPVVHVKELAGHKTLAMTMRYAHLDPKTLQAGIALLPYK